ncbi:hypothetical protein ACS0TY_014630 [Phlomoides rotata]
MEKKSSAPLNDWHARKTRTLINRLHALIHGIALLPLFYYRITSITNSPLLPHFLIFISEVILSFLWVMGQASKWRPVTRTPYPERLPGSDKLPSIDVFICTADPNKEPTLEVMNTVISALGLDYPPDKLHVYLSDDAGSSLTFLAIKQAWEFSKLWIPFCRKYDVRNRCPEAYFEESDRCDSDSGDFLIDKNNIQKAYEEFRNCLAKIVAGVSSDVSRDHPPLVEVIRDSTANGMNSDNEKLPLLVYVAREKRPSHPHNFKAGALNVLVRVSAMISNSPYILVLDCDMYCNDPASARMAMCFHLDPKLSPKLAFVQFPQKFYNITQTHDIYDCQLRFAWEKWEGLDGLIGPILSGTGFYMKREALYGTQKLIQNDGDFNKYFGPSKELINSVNNKNYKPNYLTFAEHTLQEEIALLASCNYDNDTKWGKEARFRYFAVVEDVFTGLTLHCNGWISVYCEPSRPCFLGSSPISLGEILVQHTRWNVGLYQIALSRYSPLVYGPLRMPVSESMCYAEVAHYPLYFASFYILALVPQLCLLRGIPLYPETSSPFFLAVFWFVFVSAQLKHVQEVVTTGHRIRSWLYEQRMWMLKSWTCYAYATLGALMEKIGLSKASFLPTSKVVDDEVAKLYGMGMYDFRAPALFMVPLCTLYIINAASFVIGFGRILVGRKEMLTQAFLPLVGLILHYPLLEGMVFRKDKGRVSSYVSFLSAFVSSILLASASY